MRRAGLSACGAIVLFAVTPTGCGSDAPPSEAAASSTSSAIDNDTIDIDDPHRNAAVEINDSCTGTLITPVRVITANHCVTGDDDFNITPGSGGWGINTDGIPVHFGIDPSNYFETVQVRHNGQHVRHNASVSDPEDVATDVAILELKTRPTSLGSGSRHVQPVHIFEPGLTCPDGNVDNVIYAGYGRNNLLGGTSPNPRHVGVTDVGCSNPDCENLNRPGNPRECFV